MRFTPELLAEVNPTYRLEIFKKAVKGKENFLTYSECRKCKMIYCENLWDDLTLEQVYHDTIDHVRSKDKILSLKKRIGLIRIWNDILRLLTLSGKKRLNSLKIVDYGCGWGDFLDVVQGYGVDVLGYDEDTIKIELPKERGHNIATSIDELYSFGPIDVFVMNSVLEHLQDVEYIFKLAKGVLNTNGLLVIGVMDYRPKYIMKNVDKLKGNLPALTKNLNQVENLNIYDYKSVSSTMKRYNFNFISTGAALYITDTFLVRNSMLILKAVNKIESLSAKIITGKELGINVYAVMQK
jgi:2-polyprenyl-3-methyl-5-hydroxy-6-metoxy-1,4-benzoquinol methylase